MLAPKHEQDEEQQAFIESASRQHEHAATPGNGISRALTRPPTFYLRLLVELAMAVTIVVLLARPFSHNGPCRSTVKSSPVPQCTLSPV